MERALDALAMPPVGDDRGYRDLLAELQERSLTLQPRSPFEFSQYSVAVHESGHLVVAAHEGHQLKATRIYRDGRNGWSGDARYEYRWVNRAAELRIVLAGRRSERLFFGEHFCLRSGLDELAAAMLATSGDSEVLTREIAEIDEILFANCGTVAVIAERLLCEGEIRERELAQLVAAVPPREGPPRRRTVGELRRVACDPLATMRADQRI